MNERQQIADYFEKMLSEAAFSAPYGVLQGNQKDKKGKTYRSVTFGIARTLDAEIRIYGANFILLRWNNGTLEIFRSFKEVEKFIREKWSYCFSSDDEVIEF